MTTVRTTSNRMASFQRIAGYYGYVLRARAFRALDRIPRRTKKRKLVLVDPGLVGFFGHHFEFNRLMKAYFHSDYDVRVYSNFRALTSTVAYLMARPVFHVSTYRAYRAGQFDALYQSTRQDTANGLSKIDQDSLDSETIVVMHTVTGFQLGGVAEWYQSLPKPRRPKLFLQFQFPLEFGVQESDHADAALRARQAAGALADAGRVSFASNSRPLGALMAEKIGQSFAVMPLPIRWPHRVRDRDPGVVFGFFGGLRPEKGAQLLAAAIPEFAKRQPDARFIIHAPENETDQSAVRILQRVPQVELISQTFASKEAYFASLCRAGCILLPYDPSRYAIRTSGIFVEALGVGRLIVTTQGTWMEGEIERYPNAGILMCHFTPQSLLESLSLARERLLNCGAQLSPKGEVMTEHSGSSFCSRLLRVVDGQAV